MILGVDPKVDYAFRKLFASEANSDLLIDLLDAVLTPPPDQRIVSVEILTPFNEKDIETDKETILDVKARDPFGRQYNVEMEMCPSWTFPNRALYYWAVLHAAQLTVGDGYTMLRPTISICFVNRPLFPGVPDFHLDFQLRSSRHSQLIFSQHQSLHVLELPKFVKTPAELTGPIDAWCYFLKNGESLDTDNLPAAFAKRAVPRALEVLKMLKQTELDWHRYQSQLKARRDREANLQENRDEALQQGLQEGMQQGLQQGLQIGLASGDLVGRIHLCQRMLGLPTAPNEELLALSREELLAKAETLEHELARRVNPST